jgi:hypothetical protein
MIDARSMPTAQQPTPPPYPLSRRGALFVAGAAAAAHIVGCTTEESSDGTFGSGGQNTSSVAAGADGGAPADAGADAGTARR